jgi:hypothetical protein
MNPQSMTWANANAMAEDARRQIVRAKLAATPRSDRPQGEMTLVLLALVKTMLVMVALAAAVMLVGHQTLV